jgi:EAL domain-containing protein (putative c-di-GMP-specific phosphodiesterase class I)
LLQLGTVVALCKLLGLHVIAESVETHDRRNVLREAGCDPMQKFLVRSALPAAEFFEFLKERNGYTEHRELAKRVCWVRVQEGH